MRKIGLALIGIMGATSAEAAFIRYDVAGTLPAFESEGPFASYGPIADAAFHTVPFTGFTASYAGYFIFDEAAVDSDPSSLLSFTPVDYALSVGNLLFSSANSAATFGLNPTSNLASISLQRSFDLAPTIAGLEDTTFRFSFSVPVGSNPVIDPNSAGNFSVAATASSSTSGGYSGRFSTLGQVPTTFAASVPEPETWLMLLVGFGLLGASLRTKRRDLAGHPFSRATSCECRSNTSKCRDALCN